MSTEHGEEELPEQNVPEPGEHGARITGQNSDRSTCMGQSRGAQVCVKMALS